MSTKIEMEDFLTNLLSDLCNLLGYDDPTEEEEEET